MLAFWSGLPWRFWIWDGLWLCILQAFGGKSAAVPMGALGSAYFDPREKFHLNLGNEQGKE
jgi:hypothetical protein